MSLRYYHLAIALALLAIFIGSGQCEEEPAIINLIVNSDIPASPTRDQALETESYLLNIGNEIQKRGLYATVFSTQDLAGSRVGLRLTEMGLKKNFELGMSGNNSQEKLGNNSYEEQKAILEKSKDYVESCRICGSNEIIVRGFMPQSFSQNENTYKALNDLGIKYDVGFQAGLLYIAGHENDMWPYVIEGYNLYAVPISTFNVSGDRIVLEDSYFNRSGLSSSQWYDSLESKLDQIQGKNEPMVISLTTSVSGSGDYLEALKRFMDYAISKKAIFVTTMQLVDMAREDVRNVSLITNSTNVSGGCLTCGQTNSEIAIQPTLYNTSQAES